MNRRNFLSLLQGIPFVGALFGGTHAEAPPSRELDFLRSGINRAASLVARQHKEILRLRSNPRIEWVSVKDRLPEQLPNLFSSTPVLVSHPLYNRPLLAVCQPGGWVLLERYQEAMPNHTHWAELPAPPDNNPSTSAQL